MKNKNKRISLKKYIILCISLLLMPYMFLSITVLPVNGSERNLDCIVSKIQKENHLVKLYPYMIYYPGLGERNVLVPEFDVNGWFVYVKCDKEEIVVGNLGEPNKEYFWFKIGEKVRIQTKSKRIYIFGIKILQQEAVFGMESK